MRQDLLDKINAFADDLSVVSRWATSGDAFGHIEQIIADGEIIQNPSKPDYVYEFYCYLRILLDLAHSYEVRYSEGSKKFPKKPANKKGRAKFILYGKDDSSQALYQVCAGTNVRRFDIDNYTIAADISFQNGDASDDPDESDVVMIMDAKYTAKKEQENIDITTLKEFAKSIIDLEVLSASSQNILFTDLTKILGNSLLTNKSVSDYHKAFCRSNGIKQVGKFNLNDIPEVIG